MAAGGGTKGQIHGLVIRGLLNEVSSRRRVGAITDGNDSAN
jgi:hypothetical protein